MPRLIHVNGPPAIGKSTIAAMYADDHPGTLLLDIDRIRTLVGGWKGDFVGTGELVRPLAQAMAEIHLDGGHDVVLPQFLGRLDEINAFERAAISRGAQFVELMLMDTLESSVQRFTDRASSTDDAMLRTITSVVDQSGGASHLAELHAQLVRVLAVRQTAILVPTMPGDPGATYRAVLRIIESAPDASTPSF